MAAKDVELDAKPRSASHAEACFWLAFGELEYLSGLTSSSALIEQQSAVFNSQTCSAGFRILLFVSNVSIFEQAAAGRIPSFVVGTCVRFDPRAVAQWLRKM
jgi:hypothetical protein